MGSQSAESPRRLSSLSRCCSLGVTAPKDLLGPVPQNHHFQSTSLSTVMISENQNFNSGNYPGSGEGSFDFSRIQWITSDTFNEFAAGAVGGIAGLVLGHPMDTLKILMQNSQQKPTTVGIIHSVKQFGLTNFFRGLTLPFCSYAVINAVTFGVYKTTLKELDPTEQSVPACIAAGAAAGLVQLIPGTPIELIKIQQQNTATTSMPNPSIGRCLQLIIQQHGLRGLYVGFFAHALRDIPGFTVYFSAYTALFRYNCSLGISPFWASLVSGAAGGALSWCVSLPFDIVKTRMQSGSLNTMKDVVHSLLKENNYAIFFRGFNVTMMRALTVNACTFAVYERCYAALNKTTSRTRIYETQET